ncbi:MAG: hypothetical protein Q4D33_02030 [Prevotellaceae bacterium]|nr:hypothetical protein [Prevotellaceae bacterium]
MKKIKYFKENIKKMKVKGRFVFVLVGNMLVSADFFVNFVANFSSDNIFVVSGCFQSN